MTRIVVHSLLLQKRSSDTEAILENVDISVNMSVCSLDLTGSPLSLDLDENDTFNIVQDRPNNWSHEETKHFPLKLNQVRYGLFMNGMVMIVNCFSLN